MHTSALPFFGLIRVSGEDRASFLHGQLSNHIEGLAEGEACYATYNTPKGRVIANMLVFNRGEDLLLLTAADLVEALCKRLRMFVLRAKAVFEPLPGYGAAGRLNEDATALPHGGILLAGEKDKLPAYDAEAENAWQLHEIRSGYPWISEATKESCVAQMLNQHTIGGVHFKKGCYPGQEIIARAQYRGQVKRGLAVLSGSSLEAAGIAVLQDGAEAGIIINTACTAEGSLSLAVIKHSAAAAPLTDADGNPLQQQQLFFDTAEAE